MALRESFQYSYSFFKSTKVVNKTWFKITTGKGTIDCVETNVNS